MSLRIESSVMEADAHLGADFAAPAKHQPHEYLLAGACHA